MGTLQLNNSSFQLPAVALRGFVVFPKMVLHFDVGRKKSIDAINASMESDRKIFLVTQKDVSVEDPNGDDLYQIGVVAEVRQVLKMPDDSVKVLVEGLYRAKIFEIIESDPYFVISITEHPLAVIRQKNRCDALVRTVKELFDEYSVLVPKMPKDMMIEVSSAQDAISIAEYIAGNIMFKVEDKQRILEEGNPLKRLEIIVAILEKEIDILSLEHDIIARVREQMDKNQRDYFLREQMKIISSELGEEDSVYDEAQEYREKILSLSAPDEVTEKLLKEVDKLTKMPYNSQEAAVIRTYLDTCIELPFNKYSKEKLDIEKARKILEKDHYGMIKVKERILEMIAVRSLNQHLQGQIICLVGPPGVGKTSIAKSIARAMGRNYVRIALGGVKDESDIRGHRKTYVGSMPGRIIDAMKRAGTRNPLILLDEIDKMSNDFRGDPSSAMLEVLDSEQNVSFRDHYLEIPFDLSEVLFITTANTTQSIPAPLIDRMDMIELSSYTREEKFNIAKKFLIKKQLAKNGLTAKMITISDEAIFSIIDDYTRESGVRNLEREIAKILRKSAKIIVSQEAKIAKITKENLTDFLGIKKYSPDITAEDDAVGVVNGLAWTSVGGEIMPIEVSVLDGSGKIELTGNLGDVMKESAKIAISYVRSIAAQYQIDSNFYKDKDIHIHVPEGAVPKDGPSAGIALATAILSALSGIPVRQGLAMTGEITLRGRVLPIGGLKEKSMAAHRANIKKVLIPDDNLPDLSEIDQKVKDDISFIPVKYASDVFKNALKLLDGNMMELTVEPIAKNDLSSIKTGFIRKS